MENNVINNLPNEIWVMIVNLLNDLRTCWNVCLVSHQLFDCAWDRLSVLDNGHLRVTIGGQKGAGKCNLIGYLLWHMGLVPPNLRAKAEEHKDRRYSCAYDLMNERCKSSSLAFDNSSTSFTLHVDKFRRVTLNHFTDRQAKNQFTLQPIKPDVLLCMVHWHLTDRTDTYYKEFVDTMQVAQQFGIGNVVVAITHLERDLDNMGHWYIVLTNELMAHCHKHNITIPNIEFIPINSLTGENILSALSSESPYKAFYKGRPLMDLLLSAKRNDLFGLANKPARFLVHDMDVKKVKGLVIAGSICQKDVLMCGSGQTYKVKAIWRDDYAETNQIATGSVATIELDSAVSYRSWGDIKLLGSNLRIATKFMARIHIILKPEIIRVGFTCIVSFLGRDIPVSIKFLRKDTKEILDYWSVNSDESYLVEITLRKAIALETTADNETMALFYLRGQRQYYPWKFAFGSVLSIIE